MRLAAAVVRRALRLAPSVRRRVAARRTEAALVALDRQQDIFHGWPKATAFRAYARASIRYEATSLPFPIHVLWPADETSHPSVAEFRRGWGALAAAVEVTPVPGDHLDVVTTTVGELATVLRDVLAAVEGDGAGSVRTVRGIASAKTGAA